MLLSKILPLHSAYARGPQPASPQSVYHLENLLENYQKHHHDDPASSPKFSRDNMRSRLLGESLTYSFFGLSVTPSSTQFSRRQGGLDHTGSLKRSEVAALLLNQVFGAGNIVWNRQSDRIEIVTAEGFSLRFGGTNLVEAAMYLPRIHSSILGRIINGQIPEGVASVTVQVGGETKEFAMAASPIEIGLKLSNAMGVADRLDEEVETALDRVLTNRPRPTLPAGPFILPAALPHCG